MSTTKQATQDDKQQAAPTTPTKPKDDYPHLSNPNAAIYVRAVMERAKEDFAACLKKLPGKKMLVLDEDLIGPLGLVADTQYIRVRTNACTHVYIFRKMMWKKLQDLQQSHLIRQQKILYTLCDQRFIWWSGLQRKSNISKQPKIHQSHNHQLQTRAKRRTTRLHQRLRNQKVTQKIVILTRLQIRVTKSLPYSLYRDWRSFASVFCMSSVLKVVCIM